MKGLNAILITVISVYSFTSCEEVNSLADVQFETDFEDTFNVNEQTATEPDGSAKVSMTGEVDLTTGDVADYVDKLKDISVKKIQITISQYNGPASAELSGQINFGGGIELDIPPTNMNDLFNNGQTIDLSDQANAFNFIKNQLLNQKQLVYALDGVISEVPVEATILVKYTLDVTANPL